MEALKEKNRSVYRRVAAIDRKYVLLKKLLQDQTLRRHRLAEEEELLCGFDSRLAWPDTVWELAEGVMDTHGSDRIVVTFTAENIHALDTVPPHVVCTRIRGQCQQHSNWQRVQAHTIEREREVQFQIAAEINAKRKEMRPKGVE